MKILICNVGSTSLKYQLFAMEREQVLCSGGVERVGAPVGRFYAKNHTTGAQHEEAATFATHREAISRMLDELLADGLSSLEELPPIEKVSFGEPVEPEQPSAGEEG